MSCISRGSRPNRFLPSNSARPLMRAPWVNPMMVWVETLFPEPDSPTMPRVLPASTVNEMLRTALTTPSGVWNETVRSSTSSNGMRAPERLSREGFGDLSKHGGLKASRLQPPVSNSAAGQPHVRGVDLLECRNVHRVVRVTCVVGALVLVGNREERGVLHDLLVSLCPQCVRLRLVLLLRRLIDQRVGGRVVVEAEVTAARRERRTICTIEQWFEEGQCGIAVPV